jgi:peptidoglycan/LPS O-acetylase OafA/YrhL
MATEATGGEAASRSNLALGLGVGAVLAMLVGMVIAGEDDENVWIWFVMAALGLGALVAGLMAGRGKPVGRALIGTVLGALTLVLFLLFATGILS